MAKFTIPLEVKYRSATYTPPINRPKYNLKAGESVLVRVYGCYQVNDGEDINPYFVVELEDGRCTYAAPEHIQFIKEEDEC
jgi:hypothetical protein